MAHVYLLVEGQSEEAFVKKLLTPHYAELGLYLVPIVASTSPRQKGGVVSYAKIRPQLVRLCRQHAYGYVTTLFDLYALPGDFPGKASAAYPSLGSGAQKAEFIEAQMAADIGERNFIPNLLVHEFEALLFAGIDSFKVWTDDDNVLRPLSKIRGAMQPEDINDGPLTAPSKRILAAFPAYQKTLHGPSIACDTGLHAIRAACPHFDRWLESIEALV